MPEDMLGLAVLAVLVLPLAVLAQEAVVAVVVALTVQELRALVVALAFLVRVRVGQVAPLIPLEQHLRAAQVRADLVVVMAVLGESLVLPELAQSVLFGPELCVRSHQLVPAIFN